MEFSGSDSCNDCRIGRIQQRSQAPRFQLCWIDGHLRTHASGRHGQRSLNRLLSISRRAPARDADIDMSTVTKKILQERQPFDVAWRTVDGLRIRFATDGKGDEKVVLFSPWPESIFAFAPVWSGLTKQFEVFALDLPGFGRSEARDDILAPQPMGEFIAKALDAFGLTSVHAVGLDIGSPSVLFAALARPQLFRSLIVGAGASTYPLTVEGALKSMIEAEVLPSLNAVEVVGRFLGSIRGYSVPR